MRIKVREEILNFIYWERKLYLKHLKHFHLHSAEELPVLLSRMVHDSCKAEAVALPPCDGVRPLSWVHTILIPSSGHRSNMMYADQSGLLLWPEQQIQMYVPLTVVRVVSIGWTFTDTGLVALLFTFQGIIKLLALTRIKEIRIFMVIYPFVHFMTFSFAHV